MISFTPRQTSGSEVSLEFEAMPAKSFGIEFDGAGHEVLDITLEWEALQRYFSDLRLEWVAGGSAEGGPRRSTQRSSPREWVPEGSRCGRVGSRNFNHRHR